MGRTGALIAPVVEHMARCLIAQSTRLYVDETTAPVLDPGRGKTKMGSLWAVLRDDRGRGWHRPTGCRVPLPPGRKGEYAAEILHGFNGTIQVDAYGAYTHLATPKRTGGDPLRLAKLARFLIRMGHDNRMVMAAAYIARRAAVFAPEFDVAVAIKT